MPHVSNNIGHEFDNPTQITGGQTAPRPTAPLVTSELFRDDSRKEQRQQETFRGPEFGEELARSRDLSTNFPEQILDFLGPLLIPQQRASARGRRNLQDVFRRTGGSKSSFAGRRFEEFERDASLNEILGLVKGAQSFFKPLAALQQNRLAVAGSPLSRSSGSSRSTGTTRSTGFGFAPQQRITDLGPRSAQGGGGSSLSEQFPEGTLAALRENPFSGFGPSFASLRPPSEGGGGGSFGEDGSGGGSLAPNLVESGGGGGGGTFFDPGTGFGLGAGRANDFGINDFEFNF